MGVTSMENQGRPYGIIYLVTNLVNGKKYVGYTTQQIEQRWRDHLKIAKNGKGYSLHNAIRKYEIENFSIEQIDEANGKKELCIKEEYWIFELETYAGNKRGYNETWGGDGGPLTEEIKKRISVANKGKRLGIKSSRETRKKQSDAHKGKHCGELNGMYGHRYTQKELEEMKISRSKKWENRSTWWYIVKFSNDKIYEGPTLCGICSKNKLRYGIIYKVLHNENYGKSFPERMKHQEYIGCKVTKVPRTDR